MTGRTLPKPIWVVNLRGAKKEHLVAADEFGQPYKRLGRQIPYAPDADRRVGLGDELAQLARDRLLYNLERSPRRVRWGRRWKRRQLTHLPQKSRVKGRFLHRRLAEHLIRDRQQAGSVAPHVLVRRIGRPLSPGALGAALDAV